MALPTIIMLGDSQEWIPDMVEKAKSLKVNAGFEEKIDVGPLCYPELKQRIESIIGTAEKEGAKILLDGRGVKVSNYPNGNFIGPTIIDNVTADMTCYKEEIFGPVMCIVRLKTL